MRYGSLSVETSYQPSVLPCSAAMRARVGDQAVDERHVGAVQLAFVDEGQLDVARHEHLARSARRARRRRRSHCRRCRRSGIGQLAWRRGANARVTAADSPRALNELVGIERLVLDVELVEAERGAESRRVNQRRPALAERDRRSRRRGAASARDTATWSARGRRVTPAARRAPRPGRSGRAAARRTRRGGGARGLERRRRRRARSTRGA